MTLPMKIGLGVAGLLWAMGCFYVGLVLTFPGEAASERMTYEIDQATKGAWQVSAGNVRPWWLSGATLKDVQVLSVPTGRRAASEAPSLVLQAASVSARADLMRLLAGDQAGYLDASLYGGTLAGHVSQSESAMVIDLRGDELDLSRYPVGGESWSVEVAGLLGLDIDLTLDKEDVSASEGSVSLSIDGLTLSEVAIMGGDPMEQRASFKTAVLKLVVEDGKARVKKGSFKGDIAEITIDGNVSLNKDLSRSSLNLSVVIRILDESLDGMAKLAMSDARDDEGRYHYKLSGTLSSYRFRADRRSARGAAARSTSTPTNSSRSTRGRAALRDPPEAPDKDEGYRSKRGDEEAGEPRRSGRRRPESRRPRRPVEPDDDESPPDHDDGPDDREFDDDEEFDEEDLDDGEPFQE